MRSWTRFESPRLAMTKNLVTGPGTASCSSDFPCSALPVVLLSWLLPLPATSWKDYRDPLALVGRQAEGNPAVLKLSRPRMCSRTRGGSELQQNIQELITILCLFVYLFVGDIKLRCVLQLHVQLQRSRHYGALTSLFLLAAIRHIRSIDLTATILTCAPSARNIRGSSAGCPYVFFFSHPF